jgi:hypothetical protein
MPLIHLLPKLEIPSRFQPGAVQFELVKYASAQWRLQNLRAPNLIMNKIFTVFIVLSAFCQIISAQPVLEFSDLPAGSYSTQFYVVTQPGTTNVDDNGENVIWDLTSATLQLGGTSVLGPASQTPYASQYPAANWCFSQDLFGISQQYAYYSASTSALELLAQGLPNDPNNYTDPKSILQFPLSYLGSFTDGYVDQDGSASVTWYYVGHGTAITDIGTYTNIAKMVSSEGDFIFWHTQPLHPFIVFDGSTVLVFVEGATNISEPAISNVRLYPNPAGDRLNLEGTVCDRFSIIDIAGRVMNEGRSTGTDRHQIDVSMLMPGAYQIILREGDTLRSLQFIKS